MEIKNQRILVTGINDMVGSLEVGKDATLIITDGDPFLFDTQVLQAFIKGRDVDLNDRHKMLYTKYQEKYHQKDLLESAD